MFVKLYILVLLGASFLFLTKADHNENEKICMTESLFKSALHMTNKDQWQSERPVFFAFLKNHITFTGSDVLTFDEVTTNIGNGYNKNTGLFTAPNDGIYIFGCEMVAGGGNKVHYSINKNNNFFTAGYVSKTDHANSNAQHVILELKKGDTISIRHRGTSSEKLHGRRHSYVYGYQLN